MENSHENTFIGNFILNNAIGNYTLDLIDNSNDRFKLNGTNLSVKIQNKNYARFSRKFFFYRQLKNLIHIAVKIIIVH